jgi:UDPglucose 6-dehydrogenase
MSGITISILGSGNVGKRIGLNFAKFNNVIFYDTSEIVAEELNNQGQLSTLDINFALMNSSVSFICVPTPIKENGLYDTKFLRDISKSIGNVLKNKNEYHTIVIKSTMTPGTTEDIIIPTIENYSEKIEGENFGILHCPEFLTVISNTWTEETKFCITPNDEERIVLGEGENKKAGDMITELYNITNHGVPVLRTNYKTAEMTKLVANNRLALAISFSNEIFLASEEMRKQGIDIDVDFVIQSMSLDKRIGKYGSVFRKAWGGPCFLKDTVALETFIKNKTGKSHNLISCSIEINNEMKDKYGIRE